MASLVKENLESVLRRISAAANSVGRNPRDVLLVAATKTQSLDRVAEYEEACRSLGIRAVCGENYAQELAEKAQAFPNIEWHFIGALQRNKAVLVARRAKVVQSVDSIKLLKALNAAAASSNDTLKVLLQINISNDPAKHGFSVEELQASAAEIVAATNISVVGVMTILQYGLSAEDVERYYSALRSVGDSLAKVGIVVADGVSPATISMGMSDDFDVAIRAGATMVRVGSAIFGPRQ